MSKLAVRQREARRVLVKPSARRVHIPIKMVGPNVRRAHEKVDSCVVKRGAFGWGWHECPYHLIYIEEAA